MEREICAINWLGAFSPINRLTRIQISGPREDADGQNQRKERKKVDGKKV